MSSTTVRLTRKELYEEIWKISVAGVCTAPKILDKYDCLKQHQGLYVYEQLEVDPPGSI